MSARLTTADHRLRAITEAQWQSTVTGLLALTGWTWHHPPRAGIRAHGTIRAVTAGFPDLVAVRGCRLIFAELKRETGRTSEAQDGWLAALAAASVEVYCWKPSDLAEVRDVLGRRQETG